MAGQRGHTYTGARAYVRTHAHGSFIHAASSARRTGQLPVRLEESSAPRFIGLLPILSHAQNAAKHTVASVYVRARVRTYTDAGSGRITRRYRHGK